MDLEAHPINGFDSALVEEEVHLEVLDINQDTVII